MSTFYDRRTKAFRLFHYLDIAGYILSAVVVIWMYSIHVRSIVQYPYFTPAANVEELAYTYISSNNFNTFGFLASGFLQDFAASPHRSDHPYVYDHMPPGPDVARALVMRATGGNFVWTAIFFASLVPIGFIFYFLFLRLVFENRFVLDGIFLFLLTPWGQYIGHFSNPIWNAFLLLTFAPLVTLQWSYRYNARLLFLLMGLPLILISSVYLDYVVLSSILACWVGLYFLQIIRLDRREFVLAIAAIALGIALNLLKNFIYLGPLLFAQELFFVLANRTTGWPSQQALASFYTTHGILHHGARPPRISVLWDVVRLNFYFDGLKFFSIAAATSVLLTLEARIQSQKGLVRISPTAETYSRFKFHPKDVDFNYRYHRHANCTFSRVRARGKSLRRDQLCVAWISVYCACVARKYTPDYGNASCYPYGFKLVENEIRIFQNSVNTPGNCYWGFNLRNDATRRKNTQRRPKDEEFLFTLFVLSIPRIPVSSWSTYGSSHRLLS